MATITQSTDRFTIEVDGKDAGFAQFLDRDGRRIFFHTEIGEEFGGQGLGGQLVGKALEDTIAEGLTVVAVCPFVVKHLEKHPEFQEYAEKPSPQDLQAVGG